jgi:hypothetical protein
MIVFIARRYLHLPVDKPVDILNLSSRDRR